MSDFIEQLRKERSADVQDAADRLEEQELLIEAQQAEIARLRRLVGVLTHELESCAPFFSGQSAYGDIVKAASEGRAALEQKP